MRGECERAAQLAHVGKRVKGIVKEPQVENGSTGQHSRERLTHSIELRAGLRGAGPFPQPFVFGKVRRSDSLQIWSSAVPSDILAPTKTTQTKITFRAISCLGLAFVGHL